MAPPPYLTLAVVFTCNSSSLIIIFAVNIAKKRFQIKGNILKITQKSIKRTKRLKTTKIRKKSGNIYSLPSRWLFLGLANIIDTDNPQLIILVED